MLVFRHHHFPEFFSRTFMPAQITSFRFGGGRYFQVPQKVEQTLCKRLRPPSGPVVPNDLSAPGAQVANIQDGPALTAYHLVIADEPDHGLIA
jgi:hypothetical protein